MTNRILNVCMTLRMNATAVHMSDAVSSHCKCFYYEDCLGTSAGFPSKVKENVSVCLCHLSACVSAYLSDRPTPQMSSFKEFAVFVVVLHVSQHALCVEVEVDEGQESVLLPCHSNVSVGSTVLWGRSSLRVHARDQSGDVLQHQDHRYVNRTSMRADALHGGDLSLTLRKPVINDSDNYTCTVRQFGKDQDSKEVQLTVKEPPSSNLKEVVAVSVAVAVVAVAVVAGIIYFICKRRRNRDDPPESYSALELQVAEPPVQQLEVISGVESVQLPCRTTAELHDVVKVEWTDSGDRKVHVHSCVPEEPEDQNQVYRDRTEMREDPLRTGNLSLTLRFPTVRDNRTYTCSVYSRAGPPRVETRVELQVRAQQVEVDSGAESVQLPFETTADLPEDTLVVWWCDEPEPAKKVHEHGTESDQHEVYRGRTRMREDPLNTGIFTLTLNRPAVRDAGTYACRVYGAGLIFLREKTFQLTVKERRPEEDENVDNRGRRSFTDPTPLMTDQSDR
ncbi:uncharacterized protein LOC118284538 isoform X2 [Scophthalmus maximus]|uniref:uncharacterized protein LOC118284538 isoform X2 n=1 Tax=Scophthalmus maximus TaxID=52904 RepID=UPI001FA8E773|nr:uncharacterized protein LOC118284538 isoform X2 [Scophthalmus maximus]